MHHLGDPAVRQLALEAEPQRRTLGSPEPGALAEIAVQRLHSLGADGHDPLPPALARDDAWETLIQVQVIVLIVLGIETKGGALGPPGASSGTGGGLIFSIGDSLIAPSSTSHLKDC